MNARLIQDKVPLGSQVKFSLQSGKDISGRLVEIGQEHVAIQTEKDQAPVSIFINRIDFWQLLLDDPQDAQNSQSGRSLADRSTAEEKSETDQSGGSKSPASRSEIEIEKKLIEIETRFQAKCQSAKIELEAPDFKFPDGEISSKPQLTLRLPVESYAPDTDRQIEVQIVVENEKGRSPAESLELVLEGDQAFLEVTEPHIKQDESLRGGEQSILKVPLRVTDKALASQTFSLPVYAQYRTRAGEQAQTPVENLSVRLYSKDEFENIENPYSAYAEGGIVGDPDMFFGRNELIQNIASAIQESRLQSKCVMVFGQKRSGKSSVLYHLKALLKKEKKLLIIDLENIGAIQDENSSVPLLYQILKSILIELKYAIEDRVDDGFSPLALSIPDDSEFYQHPAPLQYFQNTFRNFIRQVSNQEDWRGVRVVLLIDEFQYIYARIVDGKIPESFMQNWKALLQANYFHAVLVGQDVMPKFKLRFPNEFGTTQDERVTYLKLDDARRLIDEPIRIGGKQGESRYRERAIERILDLTSGSPFYIQILCNRLVEYMNVKRAKLVTEADVEQVKNELIRGVNALGLDKFDNLINSGDTSEDAISDEDALKILKTIAANSKTGPCHRDKIDCDTSLPVNTILDDLVERDVVKREQGHYYQIQVGLFKGWLSVNG